MTPTLQAADERKPLSLLTLHKYNTDEVKAHWPNLVLPKLKRDREGLLWAWRSVRPDLTSTHGYRWPFPGRWAEAAGPFEQTNKAGCPRVVGDGICLATTVGGAGSSGIKLGTALICAYRTEDVLGSERAGEKLRVKRAWVAEMVD